MTIVRCPRCRDEVTVPDKVSAKALVRCPLCLEEYLVSEALTGVPPALIVVGGDRHEAAAEESDDDYQLSSGGFAGVFDSRPAAEAGVAPARPSVAAAPRPRKKEKNAVVELVKVVLGGIAGLAIGLVVLWWGFQRDPLQLGPEVAAYAPWLVPAQFQGKSKTADSEAAAPAKVQTAKSPRANRPQIGDDAPLAELDPHAKGLSAAPEPAGFDSGLLDPGAGVNQVGKLPELSLDRPLDLPKPAAASLDLPLELPPANSTPSSPASPENSPDFAPAVPAPAAARPPLPDLTDLLPDDAPPAELTPGDARPVPSAMALAKAVAAATEALAKYEGLPKEDAEARREAFTRLFETTSEVGRVISFLDPQDAELSEDVARLQNLLDAVSGAKGTSKMNAVKFLASQRWPATKPDDGLLVAGTVKAIRPAGRLSEITLDASSRSEFVISMLTTMNPAELAAVGDMLVIVGRILDEPQKHLPGYDGDQPRVLLLGHAVRAPKP